MKNTDLTLDHVSEIINKELTIGSACKAGGNSKLISFQPISGLYRVYADKELVECSAYATEMIDLYNSISV